MSAQPLTLVPAELAEAIVREAVQRYVPRFEKERRVGIAVTAHQWADGPPVAVCHIPPGRKNAPVHEAVARLLCRPNLGGDLFNFNVHVVFPDSIAPGTGCTGFSARGWVRHLEQPPKIEVRGWAVLYNQPELETSVW